jgi:hypothetical protein
VVVFVVVVFVVAFVVLVFSCCISWTGVVVVVVVSVRFTFLWWCLYFVVVSVVCVVWASGEYAGYCVVVVVLCVGESRVVVVVVDCVVLCAITGRDRANTMSKPRTTANNFLDFIQFSFITFIRQYGMASITR